MTWTDSITYWPQDSATRLYNFEHIALDTHYVLLWDEEDLHSDEPELYREPYLYTAIRKKEGDTAFYIVSFEGSPTSFFQLFRQLAIDLENTAKLHSRYTYSDNDKLYDESFNGRLICDVRSHTLSTLQQQAILNVCAQIQKNLAFWFFKAGTDSSIPVTIQPLFND